MTTLIEIFEKTLNEPLFPGYTPKQEFKIKPSAIGSKCLRKVYYASAGVPEDYGFDLSGKKRMKLGDAVHEVLHSTFKKSGILIEYYNPDGSFIKDWKDPTKLDTEFPIKSEDLFIKKGKIDAVLNIDNQLWIGEYKSINSRGFTSLTAPKSDHVVQAVIYLYVFNLMLAQGAFSHIKELEGFTKAEGVRWLYVNKDDTEMKEYTMTKGDKIFTEIVEKIMNIRQSYETKTLPPTTQDWCNSCSWRDKCKKNYNIE